MKGFNLRRASRHALLATASLAAVMAQPAAAQQAEPPAAQPSEGDIVVTGIRETLQTSINQKKLDTAIVDTLSSSEIGDLPALSVGEAIQTITGATTHREKGGASEIALRGLGSFLSNTTFNGRDATNGSGDRAVNFNQFPSELVNNIKIYKSQQANLIEGGVAGSIEIGTLRPLDYGRRAIQAEIKGNYSPYQDKVTGSSAWGWRGTLSYIDQFFDKTLGIAIGVQRNKTNNPEETVAGSSTWVACNAAITVANNNCTEVARPNAANAPFYLVPNAITYRQISENDQRDAIFGSAQWRPSDRLNVNLDVQYSTREFVENRTDLNLSEARYGLTNVVYDPATHIVQKLNGLSSLESTNTILSRVEEYLGGGLAAEWKPTDRLTLSADGSYSRTIRKDVERNARLRTDPLDVNGTRTVFNNMRIPYTYELVPGNYAATITIDPRFNLNNPDLFWDDARMRRDENRRENVIWAGRADARYAMDGFLSSIAVGGRWARQTYFDYDDRKEFNLNPAITEDRRINQLCRRGAFPQTGFLEDARGNTINSWASFDANCLFREYVGSVDPGRNTDIRSVLNRDVTETTWAGYAMGEYRGELGAMGVRGNFGVRVVRTDLTSNGLRSDLNVVTNADGSIRLVPSGNFQTVTIEAGSTRVLPSANAVFEASPKLQFRLAGYRAMSRPAPSALGSGRNIQLEDGTNFTSVADAINLITANGSPRLLPLMSWNLDTAAEWYPNRDSIVAGTLYYKKFTGGFIPVQIDEPFTIGGQAVTVPVVQTANSPQKSDVYGLEVTLANRFSWLPGLLSGFGGKVSYSLAFSNFENEDVRLGDVLDPTTGTVTQGIIPPANLSGYSKHVLSGQLYYQYKGLSLQGIYNYRSKYYQDFVGGNTQLRYVAGNDTVDLRASYNIDRDISLRFEAVNITNEPKVTYMPVLGSVRQYHFYGARYFIGVRARLR